MKQIKLGLFIVLFLVDQQVAGQYILPLYTPGNSGGLSTDNINFAFSVTGQNVIGIAENCGNKVFFGVLAPLILTTDITQSEKLKNAMLGQYYPNPFRRKTTIPFKMAQKEKVRLLVTNVLGEPVKILLHQVMPPGEHNILFSTDRLTPGIYLYQLEVEGMVLVKPMSVTK